LFEKSAQSEEVIFEGNENAFHLPPAKLSNDEEEDDGWITTKRKA
jgi:hypothetical protein